MPPTLAELRARPDDRELLLVYADWLQSQGHPRGELILVQDAEARCDTVEEFERARARAIELIESSAELTPELPMLAEDSPSKVWALWQRGFVRRLELLIDQPAPAPGLGLWGWCDLLASLLEHPSMALLEELLLRVDLRGEPLDEAEAALAIVTHALGRWQADPARPLLLALWTSRPPSSDQRDRYMMELPGPRKLWYSTDITRFLPPRRLPIARLEEALAGRGVSLERFDLLWFDAQGLFRELFDAIDVGGQLQSNGDPSLAVHVRHMAERRRAPVLAQRDGVAQRRIAGVIDSLAARFDRPADTHPLTPRRLVKPELIALADACARLGADDSLASALARFRKIEWWWIEERCDGRTWSGLLGLGDAQLLALARIA